MIFIIIVSPIAEELIFHGVLLNRLRLVVPVLFSIFISSLLFAALHSFGSIFSAFIFAVCMAILYLKTDNILVPIFAHFLNNLFAESIVFIDKQEIIFNNVLVMNCISIVAVLSFIIILIFIVKQLNNLKY
ncbi:CPBP family intramembrane glutamic endopeptidase [uncultured Methanobrevibacter sp.]|uniref:CPBP family intramembrane glutamic endopeptidase n=1 Tax=uncultured Methanobrevibacter sp. TaxID=253161 RepID=UPI0025EF87D3|nr:CPBP family intramembrane glutamic endopeptidase [uncultured Methanobrevibacter sp.]